MTHDKLISKYEFLKLLFFDIDSRKCIDDETSNIILNAIMDFENGVFNWYRLKNENHTKENPVYVVWYESLHDINHLCRNLRNKLGSWNDNVITVLKNFIFNAKYLLDDIKIENPIAYTMSCPDDNIKITQYHIFED